MEKRQISQEEVELRKQIEVLESEIFCMTRSAELLADRLAGRISEDALDREADRLPHGSLHDQASTLKCVVAHIGDNSVAEFAITVAKLGISHEKVSLIYKMGDELALKTLKNILRDKKADLAKIPA